MSTRTLERVAALSLTTGLVSLIAAIALLWIPGDLPAPVDVSAARSTLAKAQVLRSETYAADDRFDTLIEGLMTGLGFGTPRQIAHELDHVATARALERALGRRTPETERSITGALARANESLSALAASRPLVDTSSGEGRALAAVASLVAALLLLGSGSALAMRSLAVRRAELVAIAERLAIPVERAVDGSLGEEVTIYTLTRNRTVVHETATAVLAPAPARTPDPTPPAAFVQPRPQSAPPQAFEAPEQAFPPDPLPPQRFLLDIEPLSKGTDD